MVILLIITNLLLLGILRHLGCIITLLKKMKKEKPEHDHHDHPGKDAITGYISSFSIYENELLITKIKGKLNIMAVTMTDTQQASGVLTFKDKKLAVTDVPDGAVTVASSDTNVFTVSYEDSTNTVTVVAGQPGVAALSITATNKAGNNIPFEDIAIEVTSGDADTGGVEFGAPTEQP